MKKTPQSQLGLQRGTVKIVPYDPAWPRLFEEEKKTLEAAVGTHVEAIHHFGSTAIPGMPAKPIIDMLMVVTSFDLLPALTDALQPLSYIYRGRKSDPDRLLFVKEPEGKEFRTHHIHVNESEEWKKELFFRDYLRRDRAAAKEYADLKRRLAEQHADDRASYRAEKDRWIETLLARATQE